MTIAAEPADAPGSLALVDRYLAELMVRLDDDVCRGDPAAEARAFGPPGGTFLVVRLAGAASPSPPGELWYRKPTDSRGFPIPERPEGGGTAIGCGAVRAIGEATGEIKRMWLAPEVRGRGVGRRLLAALEDEARRLGHRVLRLDTRRELTEAVALYRSAGYREVPDYNANPDADAWFEKSLV